MSKIIAKPYIIDIESKSTTIIRNKNYRFFLGDTVDIILKITKDGVSKYLDTCTADVIYKNLDNGTIKEHLFTDGGITVDNNVISIRPKDNSFDIGNNTINVKIKSTDEIVFLAPILFYVSPTVEGEIIENYADEIKSLEGINVAIEKIATIDETVTNMEQNINDKIAYMENDISNKYGTFSSTLTSEMDAFGEHINADMEAIDSKVNNKLYEIDNTFVKTTTFTPVVAGTYVNFESQSISIPVLDLVHYSIALKTSGSAYNSQSINSSIAFLSFTIEPLTGVTSICRSYLFTMIDKSIQGVTISPTIMFKLSDGSLSASLPTGELGYKIVVTTKIKSQYISNAKCVSSPIGIDLF